MDSPRRAEALNANAKGLRPGRQYTVAVSITATVEKGTIRLPDGLYVPDGTHVRLEIATAGASQWPADYFDRTAGALAGESLERPAQSTPYCFRSHYQEARKREKQGD